MSNVEKKENKDNKDEGKGEKKHIPLDE